MVALALRNPAILICLVENARNQTKRESLHLTIGHYLRNITRLADQYFEKSTNFRDKDRQRIYLKDIDCPPVWHDKLREHLPPNLFYLNSSIGEIGGPGADDETLPTGGKRKGRGIAAAGDLMSSLPPAMRAENMMCYIGHEGTYTPAHREMCGSLGHNIMVETSNLLGDDGKPEKPGSSIWFMTESKDRHSVSEYWLSILGHDIEVEDHFAQIAAWKKAPFSVYVVEQRAGDFILIPPLAPHQVWNRGTRTMKAAWNRTTVDTLELAMKEALPRARMVCRDEQYKNKAIVYYTLQKYSALLAKARDQQRTAPSPQAQAALRQSPRIRQLQKDFKRLFHLFKDILLSEMFAPDHPHERNVQYFPYESNITCAYCRGNIFNRFLTCPTCDDLLGTPEPEPYDVCMECYAMGRSCGCISKLRWAEQFKWKELLHRYEVWRKQYIDLEGVEKEGSPLAIQEERQRLGKNTLAQVCQVQLRRRPLVDVHKPQNEENDEDEESDENEQIEIGDDGFVKKKRKKHNHPDSWYKNHHRCHVCCKRHENWKMVECGCKRWWCYGTLFRGYDLLPQQIMEDPNWSCPHCKGICSAGSSCRNDPRQTPYQPAGTLLGHDTRKVADVRSVESLVDFSVSNLSWLKESRETPAENARLRRRQEEANRAKANDPTLDDPYVSDSARNDENDPRYGIEYEQYDSSILDPQLVDPSASRDAEEEFIDPSLRQKRTATTGGFTSVNQPRSNALPVSAMLNGVRPTRNESAASPEYPDYEPASQAGFVAPEAVMYQPPPLNDKDAESDSVYAEADEPGSGSRKRRRDTNETLDVIKTAQPKKRSREERNSFPPKPVNNATKQYRKEQERKALEEARRKGNFIKVSAALRGKSKLIMLSVGREKLREFERLNRDRSEGNVLLRSDVAPPGQPFAGGAPKKNAKPKAVRIRLEKDEDFSTRRGERRSTGAGQNKKQSRQVFEDVEVPSDFEGDEDEMRGEAALETTKGGEKRRRISAWQSQRHEDDDEMLEELPESWKDSKRSGAGSLKPNGKNSSAGKPRKPAGKTVPQIRPRPSFSSGRRRFGEDVDSDDDDGDDGADFSRSEDEDGNMNSYQRNTAVVALQEEENRRAKLAAASAAASWVVPYGFDGSIDNGGVHVSDNNRAEKAKSTARANESNDEYDDDEVGVKQVASATAASSNGVRDPSGSIFNCKGGGPGKGKKIKIVSSTAAQKRKTMGDGLNHDGGMAVAKPVAMMGGRHSTG